MGTRLQGRAQTVLQERGELLRHRLRRPAHADDRAIIIDAEDDQATVRVGERGHSFPDFLELELALELGMLILAVLDPLKYGQPIHCGLRQTEASPCMMRTVSR
jgi:hypothetical protein